MNQSHARARRCHRFRRIGGYKAQDIARIHDLYPVYSPAVAYVGTGLDIDVRFELNRNW